MNAFGSLRSAAVALVFAAGTLGATIGPTFADAVATAPTRGPAQLQNSVTGLCLTADLYGHVHTESCGGSKYQQWALTEVSSSTSIIRNIQTGQCLESDGYGNGYGNLYTASCNFYAANDQAWEPAFWPGDDHDPRAFLAFNPQTNLCLESDGPLPTSTRNVPSGNAYAQQCTPGNWQYWTLG